MEALETANWALILTLELVLWVWSNGKNYNYSRIIWQKLFKFCKTHNYFAKQPGKFIDIIGGMEGKANPLPLLFVVVYCNNLLFNVKIRDLDAHRVSSEREKVTGSNPTLTCYILPFPSTSYCTSSRPHSVSQSYPNRSKWPMNNLW